MILDSLENSKRIECIHPLFKQAFYYAKSTDFSKMEEQFGDERVVHFSFTTDQESVQLDQISCWLTYTNEKTHEIIRANLDRSPI